MSFGDPLPDRVVRAILVARLTNFLDGHAAVRGQVAQAVADMLNAPTLPVVPAQSNGGSGEILALGSLFFELSTRLRLTAKERMALINGSPCAAALVADVALAVQRRVELADAVFALVAEVCGAPDEHFAPELAELWGDEHEAAALSSLRTLLEGSTRVRQPHQASVSVRILPRVLGAARRAHAAAERAARVSLSAVTDNPVYLPPSGERSLGAVNSNGGYHNAQAAPAIDGLAFAQADLCQLAQRLTDHLFQNPVTMRLVGVRRMGGQAVAHGRKRLGRRGARDRHSDAPLARWLWPERRPRTEFSGVEQSNRNWTVPGCKSRCARRHRVASVIRRWARAPSEPARAHLPDPGKLPPVDEPRALGDDCRKLTDTFARQVFD